MDRPQATATTAYQMLFETAKDPVYERLDTWGTNVHS